jgi:A/G-specific adenine glycosylase
MDFANAVCMPKAPACNACPVAAGCAAAKAGTPETWPVKAIKKPKPERHGIAFVAYSDTGAACLVKRPESGLLGGMLAFPSAGWTPADSDWNADAPLASPPFPANWTLLDDSVSHVFTHFSLTMRVAVARMGAVREGDKLVAGAAWQKVRPASLPTLMRKVWKLAEPVLINQSARHDND